MNDVSRPSRNRSVFRLTLLYIGLAALFLMMPRIWAQTAADTPAPEATAPVAEENTGSVPDITNTAVLPPEPQSIEKQSLLDPKFILDKGGPLMIPLALMSIIGLAMVLYAFMTLTRRRVVPNEFVKDLMMMLTYHRHAEARKACEKNGGPAAAIALAGISYIERVDEPDPDMMKEILQGEGARQASMMQTQISYIMDLAVISPMVGLLGTVTGMLQAFQGLSMHLSTTTPVQLVDGISNALITTVGGLVIGIPAMAFYSFFRARATRLIGQLEVMATEFLTVMVKRSHS